MQQNLQSEDTMNANSDGDNQFDSSSQTPPKQNDGDVSSSNEESSEGAVNENKAPKKTRTTLRVSKTRARVSRTDNSKNANKPKTPAKRQTTKKSSKTSGQIDEKNNNQAKYPRSSMEKALRIPRAILSQNAGKDCTEIEAAGFIGRRLGGDIRMEISSAVKFGFLERPSAKTLRLTDRAKKILRPQKQNDEIEGFREAVLDAPDLSDVYTHYRGEYLPDPVFFDNSLTEKFKVPKLNLEEFKSILLDSLRQAKLVEEHDGKIRILDVSNEGYSKNDASPTLKKLGKSLSLGVNDTCFVVMPFSHPLGNHYSLIYEPAIQKAGLKPIRADDEIFATGKIMD